MSPTPSTSSTSPSGNVEVQKDASSHTWYIGKVVEVVRPETLLIEFEGDVWPKEEFPVARVRKPARATEAELEKFRPKAGDAVELRVNATEHAPACWGEATVKKLQHSFYFVARSSSLAAAEGAGTSEAIVEKDMLRPLGHAESLASASLSQGTFKLPSTLGEWVRTPDAEGCFRHIEDQSGLICISPAKGNLRLLGDKKAITRAQLLLEVHVKHQTQIQTFQDVREKRLKALENKRNRIEGTGFKHSAEVRIDPSFVARIIGKNGEAIKAVEEKYEVAIRIIEPSDNNEEKIVRIFGNSPESLEKARAEVEYVEEVIPIESTEMNSWVLGKGGRTIHNFKETSGLIYAKLDRTGQKLTVCGTRNAVEDAVAMFETHMIYFPVFHQMDEEMEKIISQLEEYGDWSARREWTWYHERENEEEWKGSKGKGKAAKSTKGTKGAKATGKNGKADWEDEKPSQRTGGKGGGGNKHWEEEWEEEKPKGRNFRWANEEEHWDWHDNGWYEEEAEKPKSKGKGKSEKGGKTQKGGKNGKSGKGEDAAQEEDKGDDEEEDTPEVKGDKGGKGRGKGRKGERAAGHEASSDSDADRPERPAPGTRTTKRGKKGTRS